MAVDLNEVEHGPLDRDTETRRRRVDRSTAQALAAALSALAVTALVVTTSSTVLVRSGTAASSDVETGTISLEDDDGGRSLVDLEAMAPGRPVTECINIDYTGNVLPVTLSLRAETVGDIAEFVEIELERGTAGGFENCDGFVREELLVDTRLSDLVDADVEVGGFDNGGESMAFRFTFDLADEAEAAGRSGTVDFVWEAVPA
ncbi:MAG: hypothetical protein AB8G26_08015 [Ilumatobacter sp.]